VSLPGRDTLAIACAVSSGFHAGLVPQHLEEGTAAGAGFLGSAAVLAVLAAGLARRAPNRLLLDAAIVVLTGLIGAYALAATAGIPVLHPEPGPVDGLALATKAIEAAGLLAALNLKGTLSWRATIRTGRSLSR
jgi:hypothetical protein